MAVIYDINSAVVGGKISSWLSRDEMNEISNKYLSIKQLTFNGIFKFIDNLFIKSERLWEFSHKLILEKQPFAYDSSLIITDAEKV